MSSDPLYGHDQATGTVNKCPEAKAHMIRQYIASYIMSVQQSSQYEDGTLRLEVPSHVHGVRKRYLHAVEGHLIAKQKLSNLENVVLKHTQPGAITLTPSQVLASHLQLSNLQKQERHYEMLSRCVTTVEQVQPTQAQAAYSANKPGAGGNDDHYLEGYLSKAQELVQKLELAVVQVSHDLQYERKTTADLKSCTSVHTDCTTTRRNALSITRAALTNWIEVSLAKCDEMAATESTPLHDVEADPTAAKTQGHYEAYVQARARLLSAASVLIKPISGVDRSRGRRVQLDEKNHDSIFMALQRLKHGHLLHRAQKYIMNQENVHVGETVHKSDELLKEELLRLTEESHLLPAYPIVTRPSTTRRISAGHYSARAATQIDVIPDYLEPWNHAQKAAEDSIAAVIESQCREGTREAEVVAHLIGTLHSEDQAWSQLS